MQAPMHPEIQGFFPPTDDYFEYFTPDDAATCLTAMRDLESFIAAEGPFDGVIAFSQGASVATTLMLQRQRMDPARELVDPVFKCAVFLGAAVPCDPAQLELGVVCEVSFEEYGEVLHVPTTHIWGKLDPSPYPARLARLCSKAKKSIYVHDGGHAVPGSQDNDAVRQTVRMMKRSIALAKYRQQASTASSSD